VTTIPPRPAQRRVRGALAAATAAFLAVVAGVPVAATAVRSDVITVDGTAVVIVVDALGETSALRVTLGAGALESGLVTEVAVDVDGMLLGVPEGDGDGLVSGQDVLVQLDAPAGMSTDEAVAEAARGAGADVQVLDVAPAPVDATGLAATLQPASPAGAHTITVLPVYWTGIAPAPSTLTQVQTMATESAAYWSETSGGTMTFTTEVKPWAAVAAPANCGLADGGPIMQLYNNALAANGLSGTPATNNHVVVYFPHYAACGWLGLASTNDGQVWLNGMATAEVLAHEMGHNLGLGHANSLECYSVDQQTPSLQVPWGQYCWWSEYGDFADLMGNVWEMPPGNLNTALGDHLDLVNTIAPSYSHVVSAELAPLGDVTAQRAIWFPLGSGLYGYVDYRPLAGRDTRQPTWAGVQVHIGLTAASDGTGVSYLLEMNPLSASAPVPMAVGSRFTFPDTYFTLKLDAVTPASAQVRLIPPSPFVDVATGHPFYADIAWMSAEGISTGWPGPVYRPQETVSREAMAAFLYRAAGSPAFTPPATSPFVDVSTSHPFYAAIAWMAAEGISTGTVTPSGAYYKPGDPVARDAMAAFLYRAAGSPAFTAPVSSPFLDVSTGHPFYASIAWMARTGISTGWVTPSGAYYKPADGVSREAMAAFLFRHDDYLN